MIYVGEDQKEMTFSVRKNKFVLATMAVAVLLLGVASTVAASVTTITVGIRNAWYEPARELVNQFNEEHSHIHVELLPMGSQVETKEQFTIGLLTDTAPDIMAGSMAGPGAFLHLVGFEDQFVDLKPYLERSSLKSEFLPGMLDYLSDGSQILGLPLALESHLMMWNGQIFAESGLDPEVAADTWQELEEMAQRLTVRNADGDVQRLGLGGFLQGHASDESFWSLPGAPTTVDEALRQINYRRDNPLALEWIDFWSNLFHGSRVAALDRAGYSQGTTAIFIDSSVYAVRNITNAGADFPIHAAPIPRHEGGERVHAITVNQWMIWKGSDNVDAAWEFLEWISNPSTQRDYLERSGGDWIIGVAPTIGAYSDWLLEQLPVHWETIHALMTLNTRNFSEGIGLAGIERPGYYILTRIFNDPTLQPVQVLEDYAREADARLMEYYNRR